MNYYYGIVFVSTFVIPAIVSFVVGTYISNGRDR
jgi:hypothetical protein